MKRIFSKKLLYVLVVLITVANSSYLGYSLASGPKPAVKVKAATASAPAASIGVKSAKQVDVDAAKQGLLSSKGSYAFDSLEHSRVNSADTPGNLVLATYQPLGANFVLANQNLKLDDSNINPDWKTTTIAQDSLWAPAECSAKPTLLLKGRYIIIDDGKTQPTDTYNSYLSFDIQKGTYNYFGGDHFTTTQAKRENIMLVANENDKLVFYIDPLDQKGPLSSSSSFKHASGYDSGYIIRREIDPATMQYTDYHLPYTVPQGVQYFFLSATSGTADKGKTFMLSNDSDNTDYTGFITNNKIPFNSLPAVPTLTLAQNPNPPYDTDLEKQLSQPLTKELPTLASGERYDTTSYVTNFSITELGQHGAAKFVIANSRNGTQNQTPVVVDDANQVHGLTDKPILDYFSYVALGVY
jgi:hypothetical protein